MGKNSKIEWTDHTFNPWHGCTKISAGCAYCYAKTQTDRWANGKYWGKDAERRFMGDKHWTQPLNWNKAQAKKNDLAFVFSGSMCDIFEDRQDLNDARKKLWDTIDKTPWLIWLLLTKRPENIPLLMPLSVRTLSTVWLGVSVENQDHIERIDIMNDIYTNGAKFISAEPLLGPIDFGESLARVDWVIAGGESGRGSRPMDPDWARSILTQCRTYDVSFFMKQLGGFPDKRHDILTFPEDLQIREIPRQ